MKTRTSLTIILFGLAICILLLMSACSSTPGAGASALVIYEDNEAQIHPPTNSNSEPAAEIQDLSASSHSATPDGMVAFEGKVFVALTAPTASRWQSAGWSVGNQPVNTDIQQAPLDCSLNPHSGVQDQWVGGCQGYVLIPEDGAQHIAVMIIKPDGSSTMVQIAPPPGGETP